MLIEVLLAKAAKKISLALKMGFVRYEYQSKGKYRELFFWDFGPKVLMVYGQYGEYYALTGLFTLACLYGLRGNVVAFGLQIFAARKVYFGRRAVHEYYRLREEKSHMDHTPSELGEHGCNPRYQLED